MTQNVKQEDQKDMLVTLLSFAEDPKGRPYVRRTFS